MATSKSEAGVSLSIAAIIGYRTMQEIAGQSDAPSPAQAFISHDQDIAVLTAKASMTAPNQRVFVGTLTDEVDGRLAYRLTPLS